MTLYTLAQINNPTNRLFFNFDHFRVDGGEKLVAIHGVDNSTREAYEVAGVGAIMVSMIRGGECFRNVFLPEDTLFDVTPEKRG